MLTEELLPRRGETSRMRGNLQPHRAALGREVLNSASVLAVIDGVYQSSQGELVECFRVVGGSWGRQKDAVGFANFSTYLSKELIPAYEVELGAVC